MLGQKGAQKPKDRASFDELANTGIFRQVGHFFILIKYYTFFVKIAKNLMPGQNLPPKPNAQAKLDP